MTLSQLLFALQECENKVKDVQEEIQKTHAAIEELKTTDAAKQREWDDAPKILQHIQTEAKLKNLDVTALGDKQKSHREKLSRERLSSKEFARADKEADALKKQQAKIEDEVLALLERQEELKKKMATAETDRIAWAAELEKQTQEKTLLLEGLQRILQEKEKEKENVSSQIPAGYLKQFRELLEVMDGVAVAKVEDEICGGCFMGLSTGLVDRVKTHDDMSLCDSCGRMLYWAG